MYFQAKTLDQRLMYRNLKFKTNLTVIKYVIQLTVKKKDKLNTSIFAFD
jgi:hypothetical protein